MKQSRIFFLVFFLCVFCFFQKARPVFAQSGDPFEQAQILISQGQYDAAVALLDSLKGRNQRRALEAKLALYRQLGDNQKIASTIEELVAVSGYTSDLKILHAIVLRNLGGWEKAEYLLVDIEKEIQENPDHLVEYGRYLLWKQDYTNADRVFAAATALRPGFAEAMLGQAYVAVWQGHDDQAKLLVDQILIASPQHVDALILNGWLAAWRQEFPAAVDAFGKALGLAANHPEALRGLAQTYAWDGQLSQSIGYYGQLLSVQPGNVDVMLAYGRTLRDNGNYSEAVGVLTQAQQLDPSRVDVQEELSIARRWTLQVDSVLRDLKRKASLNQGEIQDLLTLGRTYSWAGKLKDSRKIYERALAQDPDNIQLLYGLGLVYERLDDLARAEKMYKRILELKPDFIDAKLHLDGMKWNYRPQLMVQYSNTISSVYDRTLLDSVALTQEHTVTAEYGQRIVSGYTLRAGYAFGYAFEKDLLFDLPNYGAWHHKVYLQNEIKFDHDITAVIRYDMHLYDNKYSINNLVNLPSNRVEHGGYLLVQVPYEFNTFGFEFSRQFFPVNTGAALDIANNHSITLSDDLQIAENYSAFVAFAGNRLNLLTDWSWSGIIHPRARIPFFPQAGIEYEWNFQTHPDRQIHKGFANINFMLGPRISTQLQYNLSYYTLPNDFGHTGQMIAGWSPTNSLQVSLVGVADYYQNQISLNTILSGNYRF